MASPLAIGQRSDRCEHHILEPLTGLAGVGDRVVFVDDGLGPFLSFRR